MSVPKTINLKDNEKPLIQGLFSLFFVEGLHH